MLNEIDAKWFQKHVLDDKETVMVDFWGPGCAPCRQMMPLLDRLSENFKIVKVNVDDNYDFAAEWSISAIPTMIFFKGGKERYRLLGIQSEANLRSIIKALS